MKNKKIVDGIGILIIEVLLIYFDTLGKLLDFDIFSDNAFLRVIPMFSFVFLGFLMVIGFPYAIILIYEGIKKWK